MQSDMSQPLREAGISSRGFKETTTILQNLIGMKRKVMYSLANISRTNSGIFMICWCSDVLSRNLVSRRKPKPHRAADHPLPMVCAQPGGRTRYDERQFNNWQI